MVGWQARIKLSPLPDAVVVSLKKLGRYDLVRVLGKGAMGIVYEGRDPNLDRRVAIKTVKVENLSEEAASEYEVRFRTEARSAARLQHPNIVSVYDSDRDGDIAYLVMEYIHGDDLKHHLDRGVRYSLEQALKMIRDLLSALDYAHKQGIVHRDIKPANLLIEPGGRVKLTDFGVARIQDSGEATRTQGSMVGTLKYMSPEQVQGQKIDSRADLFSVGVVLYQLLTDKRPFDGDNDFSIIHQIIGHTPPPPSSFNARLPSAIDAVVARALAKDREERFATARDFASALQSAIRRAEDATVVPPANPFKKTDAGGTASKAPPSVTGAGGSATSGSTVTQELELVYWKDIKDSTDTEELQGFLDKFPDGIYADLARRRLRRLAEAASSPDRTVLSGRTTPPPVATSGQDFEETRMPTATMPLVTGPAPAAEDDVTRAISPPPAAPAPATEHEPTVPALRKKPAIPMVAVLAGITLAGIGLIVLMVGQGGAGRANPIVASIGSPSVAPAVPVDPVVVVTPQATPTAVAGAAQPAMAASAPAASPGSAPRRPASVAKPKTVASTGTPESFQAASVAGPHREETRPIATAVSAALHGVESCRDKLFLMREFCLAEHCDKVGARLHPLCVKRREDAKLREESQRIRN
jgi:serine/threonine protein kinase